MASVSFVNIVKKFGDVTAVNNLNIHVEDKEFLVLVGPSGCGKPPILPWAIDFVKALINRV